MPSEKSRFSILVDNELLEQIDDYWKKNHCRSRSSATVDLIRLGLETVEKQKKKKK